LVAATFYQRRVHPLVEVALLYLDMAVELDDADALCGALRDAAHAWQAHAAPETLISAGSSAGLCNEEE
jgi:hypothetical protein